MKKLTTIDEYISNFPVEVQTKLKQLRGIINILAPEAKEVISYGMPAFKLNGILMYFAAHKNHVGFYPYTSAILKFKSELLNFKTSKGTIQFPFNKSLPIELITKIVAFRVAEKSKTSTKK